MSNILRVLVLMQSLQAYIGQNEDNECGAMAHFQSSDSLTRLIYKSTSTGFDLMIDR